MKKELKALPKIENNPVPEEALPTTPTRSTTLPIFFMRSKEKILSLKFEIYERVRRVVYPSD